MTGIIKNLLKIILFIPFILLVLFGFYQTKKWRHQQIVQAKNIYIGRHFELTDYIDTAGKSIQPDFSAKEITLIDFWFKACPTCLEEMKEVETVLKGLEKKVTIVSICIDDFSIWKKLFTAPNGAWAFLAKPVTGWQHLVIKRPTGADPAKAYHENSKMLGEKLGVTSYPGVFVVNNLGNIIAMPESAIGYVKTSVEKENGFIVFLQNKKTWASLKILLLLLVSVFLYNWIFNVAFNFAKQKK